jgi:hypothetical protein
LIKLASGFEHVLNARKQPRFLGKLPFDSGFCTSGQISGDFSGKMSAPRGMPDMKKMRPMHL